MELGFSRDTTLLIAGIQRQVGLHTQEVKYVYRGSSRPHENHSPSKPAASTGIPPLL